MLLGKRVFGKHISGKYTIIMSFVVVFISTSSITQAVVIDFEEFDKPGTGWQSIGHTYESNGFIFTVLNPNEHNGLFYLERDSREYRGLLL